MIRTFILLLTFAIAYDSVSSAPVDRRYSHSTLSECRVADMEPVGMVFECPAEEDFVLVAFDFSRFPDNRIIAGPIVNEGTAIQIGSAKGILQPQEVQWAALLSDPQFGDLISASLYEIFKERAQGFSDRAELIDSDGAVLNRLPLTTETDSLEKPLELYFLSTQFRSDTVYPESTGVYEITLDGQLLSMQINYPESMIIQRFVRDVVTEVDEWQGRGLHEEALARLNSAYSEVGSMQFVLYGIQLAEEWADKEITNGSELDRLFGIVMKYTLFENEQEWGLRFRVETLLRHLMGEEQRGAEPEYLLEGYSQLILWTAGAAPFRQKAFELRSVISAREGLFWQAIRYLQNAEDLLSGVIGFDERVELLLTSAFENELRQDQRDYTMILKYGEQYHERISGNAEARFLYSRAAKYFMEAQIWASELEWLLASIAEITHLTSRRMLQEELNEAYRSALRFEKAYALNRRLFMESGETDHLNHFVLNVRGAMLSVLFHLLSSGDTASEFFSQPWDDHIYFYTETYLNAIWIQGPDGGISQLLYSAKEERSPTPLSHIELHPKPFFVADAESELAWFTAPAAEGHLIIELSAAYSPADHAGIHSVLESPDLPNSWHSLIHSNQLRGAVASATVLSALFEMADGWERLPFSGNPKEKLRGVESLRYLLVQTTDGGEGITLKDPAGEIMESEEWGASLRKELLFHQYLLIGEERILDITNSLIKDGAVFGHLKLGFHSIR